MRETHHTLLFIISFSSTLLTKLSYPPIPPPPQASCYKTCVNPHDIVGEAGESVVWWSEKKGGDEGEKDELLQQADFD